MIKVGDLLLDKFNRTTILVVIRETEIPNLENFWILHVNGILKGLLLTLNKDFLVERYTIEQNL